jgi:hypothetical protein
VDAGAHDQQQLEVASLISFNHSAVWEWYMPDGINTSVCRCSAT